MTGDEAIKLAGYAGTAIAALVGPIMAVVAVYRAQRAKAMRDVMQEGPLAPAALPTVTATDATRVVQLESEVERLKWTLELCERALENERRETQELSAALTAERTAATQERMLRLHERMVDSGLTPIDSPPTTPRGKRPRRRSE